MSGSHYLIYKELARESIIKKKNGKFPWSSGLVPELIKSAGEARIDIWKYLINQIL